MSLSEVKVSNGTGANIWVIIAENEKHIIETKTRKVREYDFEAYYKSVVEGNIAVPIEGVPVDLGLKTSSEFKTRLKQYWEDNQETSFEWSGFVKPGELEVAPGTENKWALKGDELPYYISIRAMGGNIIADAVARRDSSIVIDKTGHIQDITPEKIEITDKAIVYLQKTSSSSFVGDPQTANNNWDAATFLNSAGRHFLESDGGPIEASTLVRIVSASKTLADPGYKYMYSSDIGWIYYDKKRADSARAGKKQHWKVSKTSHPDNSPGARLHYGDRVTISNGNWPKANLGIKGKWLQCVNDDPAVWILRKDPRK